MEIDIQKYGPFGEIMVVAGCLIAVFSALVLKAVGRLKRWTWYAADVPPMFVALPARIISIALMAMTFILINLTNYLWFGFASLGFALIAARLMSKFNKLRLSYVEDIPEVGSDGKQLVQNGKPVYRKVVVGEEDNMMDDTKHQFLEARRRNPGLTTKAFMSGYGTSINDPSALWPKQILVSRSAALTDIVGYMVLCAVVSLYLAAFIVVVFNTSKKL